MDSDAKTLGELFRSKRVEKGMTVKEVESSTSIRAAYIEAIESGSLQNLISQVYMKGFMKQYAVFLGLDAAALVERYAAFFSQDMKAEPAKEFSFGLGGIEMRSGTLQRSFFKSSNLLWGLAFVGIFAAAFFLIKMLGIF